MQLFQQAGNFRIWQNPVGSIAGLANAHRTVSRLEILLLGLLGVAAPAHNLSIIDTLVISLIAALRGGHLIKGRSRD